MKDKKGIQLIKLDWNKECRLDYMRGTGFEIREPMFKKGTKSRSKSDDGENDKIRERSKYGILSPLYCSDWGDENPFEERYRCECGEVVGKFFKGEICPSCKTKVGFKDVDMKMTGWIILHHGNSVIHPIFYNKLASIIGVDQFTKIIKYDKFVNRDGHLEYKSSNSSPFYGIGMVEFKERFDEILEYYKTKKKAKLNMIEEIENEKEKVFTSCIPVYSSVLRPVYMKGDNLSYSKINSKYSSIVSVSQLLNDSEIFEKRRKKWNNEKKERMIIPHILYYIQERLMDVYNLIFQALNSKEGFIRSEILGGMINFVARNVIIPDPTLASDEIRICYMTFLELFKYEIISCIGRINNITENEATDQWLAAKIKYSSKIYEIMNYILKKRKPKIVVNRNPTINYGSILSFKIKSIKNQFADDYTLSLPPQPLSILNADFDGDVVNIISLKSKKLENKFHNAFSPKKNMFISRNDGLFNNDLNLFKDQIIGLYEFNNI